ncbi:MAG: translation initiation factor IF-2 [Bacteroidota bacterium]
MPITKKKGSHRLFKVAKELNVSTSVLVEHLKGEGHDVKDSPNSKLNSSQYELLLKEFASEKLLKEKAEQIIEKRSEDRQQKKAEEEAIDLNPADFLTASDLRDKVSPKQEEKAAKEDTPPPADTPVKLSFSAGDLAPPSEKPVEKAEVEKPAEQDPSPLKVIGKIDLDSLNKKGKKQNKPAEKAAPKAKTPPPPPPKKQEAPVKETPPVEQPPAQPKEEPKQEVSATPPTPPPPVEAKEPKQVPLPEAKTDAPVEEVTEEDGKIIRAGDNAPSLSGLKVLGKIELEPNKPKKRGKSGGDKDKKSGGSADNKKTNQSSSQDKQDDEGNKKRRRRRRRKRVSTPESNSNDSNNKDANKRGGSGSNNRKKKEKPSQKDVQSSIRNTMAQMNQRPSRDRQRMRRAKRDADAERRRMQERADEELANVLEVTEFITANEFAKMMGVSVNDIIKSCFSLGMMISINQRLSAEIIEIIAEEYNFEVDFIDVKEQEFEEELIEDKPEDLKGRNAIITVMGHVDHGKTTLLDNLRSANVAEGEAGGITQHIGAYQVQLEEGKKITFLDTPGHEAFTAMRARGAQVTDIVIVVIAADDAVMPQTKEAINHAEAAGVPIVFAINKIDKPGADPERIKGQLAEMNYLVESWGGKYQSQEISAKFGTNVDELLELVILEAEILDLKANPNRAANGTIIESRLDRGRGNVATLLVQNGTLAVGDPMVAGIHSGRVRALIDQKGKRIKQAGPSMPVQVLGLSGQPQAGDRFQVFVEESRVKEISQKRQEVYREQQFRQTDRITLEEIGRRRAIGNFNELNIIIKGDVDGSVEALAGSFLKLTTEEVAVNIILKGVGAITESDINLASASDAIIIAFNTRPTTQARILAEREKIDIRTYSVIYNAINDVKDALEGLLSPEIKEEIVGNAEVREVFKVTKVGNVAGCMVTSGKIYRNEPVRVIREGVVIYTSKLSSLKRYKDDAKEVAAGFECGLMVENYNDIKIGDIIEAYRETEVKRKLS